MGRVAPGSDNVLPSYGATKKLKLDNGEKARIVAMEFGPKEPGRAFGSWAEWVHNLTVPARTETMSDGSTREVAARKWHGTFLCPGAEDVIIEKGYDEACPLCARVPESEEFRATRKHATNIVRYTLRGATFDVIEPYSVTVLPYTFGEKIFAKLSALHDRFGDLRKKDLLLTCTNGVFQNVDIEAEENAAFYLRDEYNVVPPRFGITLKDLVVQTWTAPQAKLGDDALAQLLGSRASRTTLIDKGNALARDLGLTLGAATASIPAATPVQLDQAGIADLLKGGGGTEAPPASPAETPPAEATPAEAPPAEPPAETPPAAPPATDVSTESLDALLS